MVVRSTGLLAESGTKAHEIKKAIATSNSVVVRPDCREIIPAKNKRPASGVEALAPARDQSCGLTDPVCRASPHLQQHSVSLDSLPAHSRLSALVRDVDPSV